MNKIRDAEIAAVVLAGGKSERMPGRNKLYLPFGEHNLLTRALSKLEPQCSLLLLNCNEDVKLPASYRDVPLVRDQLQGRAGPLDGLVSTMEWIQTRHNQIRWLLSAPVDCPFLPADLLAKLREALENNDARIALASHAGRSHYGCALWSLELATAGRQAINARQFALKHFIAAHACINVEFESQQGDPFLNINTPEDYEYALATLE